MKNREIETKLVTAASFHNVETILSQMLESPMIIYEGIGTDYLWDVAGSTAKADVLRLRANLGQNGEITIKKKDKESNLNRYEVNIEISDETLGLEILTALHGEPTAVLQKRYVVYMDEKRPNLMYSIYNILGSQLGTIIEIESTNEIDVLSETTQVMEVFHRLGLHMVREERSLYDIVCKGSLDLQTTLTQTALTSKNVVSINSKRRERYVGKS